MTFATTVGAGPLQPPVTRVLFSNVTHLSRRRYFQDQNSAAARDTDAHAYIADIEPPPNATNKNASPATAIAPPPPIRRTRCSKLFSVLRFSVLRNLKAMTKGLTSRKRAIRPKITC